MAELAAAYLSLIPTLKGAGKQIGKELDGPEVKRAADRAGKDIGDRVGKEAGSRTGAGFKAALGGALAGVSVGAIVSIANDAVASFSELEDSTAAAGVVFGKNMDSIIAQSKNASSELGLSQQQVISAANTFGTYGKAAGLSGKDLANFATEQTKLAADMASFKGTSPEQAIEAIGAALRGEMEPIRSYGVLLDDATLRNEALKMGLISTTKDALTPQQKTLAAQSAILKQTSDAQGDFARTSQSTANVQKTLEANSENLRAQIGEKLAPAFTAARQAANNFLAGFAAAIDPTIARFKALAGWVQQNQAWLGPLGSAVLAAATAFAVFRVAVVAWSVVMRTAAAVQAALNAVMAANPIGLVVLAIAALIGALVYLYQNNETVRRVVDKAWAGIKVAISSVSQWWTQTAWPAMRVAFEAVGRVVGWLYNNIVKPYFTGWKIVIGAVVDWLVKTAFPAVTNAVKFVGKTFSNVVDGIGKVWAKVREYAAKPINFVIETVYMNGIKKTWDKVASAVGLDLTLPTISPIKFASGGVLPGYTPGRDVHEFFSPTGGRLSLSGGEAIMRPEFTRAVGGPAGVAALNSAARNGQAFADGGVWGWVGDIASNVGKFFSNPAGALGDLLSKPMESLLGGIGGGSIGKIAAQLPRKAVGALIDKAKSLVSTVLPSGGKAGPAMGWQAQWNAVKAMFPSAALHSAYRPGAVTAVGTPSFHGLGRAIDITPSMEIFNWLARSFPNSTELIFSPAGNRQLYKGQQTLFGEPTRGDHWDHIHWAMANGGVLPKLYDQGGWLPSGGIGMNQTGKPEAVLTPAESSALKDGLNRRPERTLVFNSTRPPSPRDVIHAMNLADLHDVGGPA